MTADGKSGRVNIFFSTMQYINVSLKGPIPKRGGGFYFDSEYKGALVKNINEWMAIFLLLAALLQ